MRCPPRHERGHPRAVALVVQPRACVAQKSPLTNRIRRHFARIKAVGWDCGRPGLLRKSKTRSRPAKLKSRSGHFEDESQDVSKTKVRTFRRRKSGRFEDESQDISKTKV